MAVLCLTVIPISSPATWAEPFRTARIFQLLRMGKAFTVDDMLRIQTDILTLEDKWLAGQLLQAGLHYEPHRP